MAPAAPTTPAINSSNRFGWDYAALARQMPPPPGATGAHGVAPIIDVHTHINGVEAVKLYERAASLYGVKLTYSMTSWDNVAAVRDILGPRIRFIAVPTWTEKDRAAEHIRNFPRRIEQFHALGSRIVKFWAAPRGVDYGSEAGNPGLLRLDAPHRLDAMKLAHELGMIFMTHVADPDTWFATKYKNAAIYGSKLDQYRPLEKLLDQFTQPWIAAHMGGWPEDLGFLSSLLSRHSNLYIDTSATKWMVRELSKHPREAFVEFLTKWNGRVLFGSDIVTHDDHLIPKQGGNEMQNKASSAAEAFDLYASRYWALRTMFETDYAGPSPIADGDLAMVEPSHYGPTDGPELRGKSVPAHLLRTLYHDAAETLLEPLQQR